MSSNRNMAKNCKLPSAATLMTEIINYEIRVEEQRQVIQALTVLSQFILHPIAV